MPPRGKERTVNLMEQEMGLEHADGKKAKLVAEEEKGAQNTTGLLSLPVEILEQMCEDLLSTSRLITKKQALESEPHLNEELVYSTDHGRLAAALRVSCLQRYYERALEACAIRGSKFWYRQPAERLERTSWLPVECPYLA
ncbi:uncharacterized protein PHACADRAFT_167410 [Phanerochaete carnosa HHB-10118-sp]|uniref:Uncharacterized protein n=1 Tax=Phanerochaete carnosa (strain HHB-10118-sp) TaxID=650164 RepID=K5VQ17_PHACS|nr:uncharacterized protein PHACADRAFT_167410 [Phanerochaete carnosa HHB-10118-sp]EKM48800.1 hypothetical protein PHACADRAFT_167410 [Phanerochaete carnosa HHB-10118-sp]